jgi:hypothetical protein
MLKHLIALTVIHQSLEPGVAASKDGKTPAVAPKNRVVQPFKKTGLAFLAANAEQEAEMFGLGCVALAPVGTPLDPESAVAEAGPVKKAAPAAQKPKAPAKPQTKAPEAAAGDDTGKADDGTGMV